MSEIIKKLKSRGYWDVTIRPEIFKKDRISKPTELSGVLQRCRVSLRGWDYPHLDEKAKQIIDDHIEQEFHWEHYIEVLRFYQSGLFVHLAGLSDDWRDVSGFWPAPRGWKPCSELSIEAAVFRATEIFDFAARLAETPAGDEVMHLDIKLVGLENRSLDVGPNRMPFVSERIAHVKEKVLFSDSRPRPELIANRRELALQAVSSLFHQFDWDAPMGVLRETQQQIGRFS